MSVSSIKLLEQFVDYCSAKNKTITSNIANIGTEKYKREDVAFKDILDGDTSGMLKRTNEKHFGTESLPAGTPYEVIQDGSTEMASGVNNVDIEKEMSDLAANSINFKFASRKISDYYKTIQSVIKGDRQ